MLDTASQDAAPARRSPVSFAVILLALAVAATLAIDAYVHLHDAADYSAVRTSVLSQADLFRIEAGLAIALAVVVLVWPRLWAWLAAALLLAGAATAVLVYTYVDVGQIGPVPNMYEPTWSLPGKVASAWAEGIGAGLALIGFALVLRRRRAAA